jgi:bacillithiol biosynthesis cysteine-adding enzyme BshC
LEDSITAAIEEMRTQLGRTDFSEELFNELRSAYRPGCTMGEGFARWLTRLLSGHGLILMDPSDPELKAMAAPLFRKEIEDAQTTNRLLAEQSAAITACGYTPQLDGKPTNLFLRKSKRDPLPFEEPGTEKFRLAPEHVLAHRAALLDRVASAPESFIPNVALRPIVQDHLLPTVAYVAGPSEIAYWAQLKPLYEHFGVVQPMVLPRPFATLVEKKIAKILDRNGLLLPDLLNRPDTLVDELVLRQGGRSILSAFERWAESNRKNLDELGNVVEAVDASLRGAVDTAGGKIDQAISVLREKTLAAEKRNSEQLVNQIQRAVDHLCPAGSFQERKLASFYYLNKYSWNFVEFLLRRLSITAIGHQVIGVEM